MTKSEPLESLRRCAGLAFPLLLASAASAAPQATAAPAKPPTKGLQLQSGDYTWKLGGYVKLDVIHDFDAIGSTDFFDVRTIPTGTSEGTDDRTRIHARQSRLNLDVRGPSSAGEVRGFVEGDFFSDQNGFRMRHAYGTVGGVLGGQTWTTFMDEDAMPETLDFESPVAFPLVRQPQVRFTHALSEKDYVAFSLEDPDSDVIAPTGVAGTVEEPLPDVNARLRLGNSRGHTQLGLFGGMARFDPDVGSSDDVLLWGLNLSTKFATTGKDSAILQATYGDGVGRYRGGVTAAPDSNGDLEAVRVLGVLGSYEHHWNEEYRSTIGYSWGDGDLPNGTPVTSTEEVTYGFVNLIWQFTARAWAGFEYLYGTRDTFDGEDGNANRVQFSLRFDL